jgi:hypothetical protein
MWDYRLSGLNIDYSRLDKELGILRARLSNRKRGLTLKIRTWIDGLLGGSSRSFRARARFLPCRGGLLSP